MSHLKMMVTGASGFVGRALVSALVKDGFSVSCPVRPRAQVLLSCVDFHEIDGIDAFTDWDESLQSCSVVVHLAARVHVMNESSQNPLEAFRTVNVEGTKNLARQAVFKEMVSNG